ncbi:sensor histidine kinase [Saccharibacillus alkalitolerans]|uniref:histidine kinase n=1 Tax=Saccharibacillus alkalitolerans TaxID=2705290 RepID=A0ABX0F0U0_9BACL|nr:HAMP domain-containing sensor histidine kinase [Saccharibacillus alkalitolerans]NGZ74602.1 HAMP domain-containing protein [Saccharibacillus alkalitolerans]
MRGRIAVKLFFATSVVMLGTLSAILFAQSLFFERFYEKARTEDVGRSLHNVASNYAQTANDPVSSARLSGRFMNDNRAALALLDADLNRRTLDPYLITLRTAEGKSVSLLLASAGTAMRDIPEGLQTGEPLTVDGIYMDEKETLMQPSVMQPNSAEPESGLTRVRGTVTELLLPADQSLDPFYSSSLVDEALAEAVRNRAGRTDELSRGETLRTEWTDKWSGLTYAVIVAPVPGAEGRYVLALASLQPVGEAVEMLRRYLIYLAPAAAAVLLLLSLLYSRLLSRPLVRLSRTSARMAKLDFSPGREPEIRSRDELGELARNLDTLGRNLAGALRQLSAANAGLSREVEEKDRSEALRKELIANISHELKTPLGIVKGFAEGLQDDVAADKRERYLQLIVGETDRMNALILDMLQLSRFEAKAIKLKPQAYDIVRQARRLTESFAERLESRGLHIVFEGDDALAVNADPRRIEQVLLNLISNAVRHARENGTIRIGLRGRGDDRAEIRIENDGAPIPEPELDRIWEQFYRAERSRDRKSGRTGLGLAIVRHILELHGSEYGAENTEKGVVFRFTLQKAALQEEERESNEEE